MHPITPDQLAILFLGAWTASSIPSYLLDRYLRKVGQKGENEPSLLAQFLVNGLAMLLMYCACLLFWTVFYPN